MDRTEGEGFGNEGSAPGTEGAASPDAGAAGRTEGAPSHGGGAAGRTEGTELGEEGSAPRTEGAASQDAGATGRTQGAVLAEEGSQGGAEDAGDAGLRSAAAVYGLLSSLLRHTQRDMSLTSLATLATLSRTGPRRITDLAAVEGVTQPSVTTLVTNLERAGLVERRSDTADKRVVRVAITDKGADYLAVRRQASIEAFASLIGDLSPAQAAALAAAIPALERLRELDDEKRDPHQPAP